MKFITNSFITSPFWGPILLWSLISLIPFILATPFCGHTLWFVMTCYCVTPETINSKNILCDHTPFLPLHALKCFQWPKLFAIEPFCKLISFLSIHYTFPFHNSTLSQETWTTQIQEKRNILKVMVMWQCASSCESMEMLDPK